MEDLNEMNGRFVDILVKRGILKDGRIIDAFKSVPRYLFVRKEYLNSAYEDFPLPLMKGSTISQPTTVAIMLEYLDLHYGHKVLEIGTGSGWNAALIGYCIGKKGSVITVEIEKDLIDFAKANIEKVGIKNISVILNDGSKGCPDRAPYDRIVYTVAASEVPSAVLRQLKIGGMLLAPIGDSFIQVLTKIERTGRSRFRRTSLGYYQFVPLRSK
jgi:protein-L-isoaspartate(D-aspartate) O-methyltransferase